MIPALVAAGAMIFRAGTVAATVGPLVKPVLRAASKFVRGTGTRPGVGSRVTKGPLMLGKQKLIGPSRPGTGQVVRIGAGTAAAIGIGTVASHRHAPQRAGSPRTAPQPQPQRAPVPRPPSTATRKCCPEGTRRMVCFKRGRVKPRKKGKFAKFVREARGQDAYEREARSQRLRKPPSAKQLAARRRFAAAARAGKIRKGRKL